MAAIEHVNAAVGVLPEHRNGQVGSQLMADINSRMKEDGFAMACLYAFRDPFYRRAGYAGCGTRIKLEVPADRMPKIDAPLPARLLESRDWKAITPCFEAFRKRYHGTSARSDEFWWWVLGGETPFAIYVVGDPVEAYALVRLKGDFWVPVEVKEFHWSTADGYRSMLMFLRSLGINKTSIHWPEPADSPLRAYFADQGISMSIGSGQAMYRALDYQAIASAIPELESKLKVIVDDPDLGVQELGSGKVHLHLTPGEFVQCALGQPAAIDILRFKGLDDERCRAADKVFGRHLVYCIDQF